MPSKQRGDAEANRLRQGCGGPSKPLANAEPVGIVLALCALALTHASVPDLARFEYSQVHMGMPVRIVLYAASEPSARAGASRAFARIASLDAEMSDYRPDSAISQVARLAPAAVTVPPDLFQVVSTALEMAKTTGGAFDPTVAPLVALWRDARKTGRLPDDAAVARARALAGWQRIELDAEQRTLRLPQAGMKLDVGGIAKGYILGAALSALRQSGVFSALIEAGGDIVVSNAPPGRAGWQIDLPDASALTPAFIQRASTLVNAAVSTSGPAAQAVEIEGVRYSHVIDPRTGRPLTWSVSAHVVAEDPVLADALATAATVVGPPGLAALRARFPSARIELVQTSAAPQVPDIASLRDKLEWTPLFNGRDLSDWTPKFSKHPLGVNLHETFRVTGGLLQVRYDKWATFSGEFGHLFYKQPFSHYLLAAEYRFTGEQLPAARQGLGWAIRNNGLMLHSQDPRTMVLDQDFPISIEVQLLGGAGTGSPRPTANVCTPGTHIVLGSQLRTAHCTNSKSRTFDGDVWVRVEVLVLGDELVRHTIDGEIVLEYSKPQIGGGNASPADPAVKIDGTPLTSGFIAIQSETAPTDFRRIEIVNLEGCADRASPAYRPYIVKHRPEMCG